MTAPNLPSNSKPRILITRLSAIGDCIHTLPLVPALRDRFPNAFIAWATQSAGGSLISGTEGLDEVIVVDRNWMKRCRDVLAMRKRLRSYQFDVSIDPQSLTKSSLLGWLSGARRRIGFTSGQARELSPWMNTIRVAPQRQHVIERYLELLRPFGIDRPVARFDVPRNATSEANMHRFVVKQRLSRFVLLNPGAGWHSKRWPHERYADVARHIRATQQRWSVVLWADEQEKRWAEEIVARSEGSAVLAPPTSLTELAELCRMADLFVGSDTGPLHLAAAVGTRCVAMYGPTKPEVCGPHGTGHETLQEWYQDGTSSERRGNDNSAMRAIESADVCGTCDRMLTSQSHVA